MRVKKLAEFCLKKTSIKNSAQSLMHPMLSASIGWRPALNDSLKQLKLAWIEVISDDYLKVDRRHWTELESLRKSSELVCHGVNLNIGGTDPLNLEYLTALKRFFDFFQPAWVSDHICWTGVLGEQSFDLLPLPYNPESLKHLVSRIHKVQDFTGREWVFENPSIYLQPENSVISEGEFFKELNRQTGCKFLLDLNNIHVSSYNLKLDAKKFLLEWPLEAVVQFHLAGGSYVNDYLIDTHDRPIESSVWELFHVALQKIGPRPTLIEWDRGFPDFQVLLNQQLKAQRMLNECAGLSNTFLSATP